MIYLKNVAEKKQYNLVNKSAIRLLLRLPQGLEVLA